jgi:hypothetical protein
MYDVLGSLFVQERFASEALNRRIIVWTENLMLTIRQAQMDTLAESQDGDSPVMRCHELATVADVDDVPELDTDFEVAEDDTPELDTEFDVSEDENPEAEGEDASPSPKA